MIASPPKASQGVFQDHGEFGFGADEVLSHLDDVTRSYSLKGTGRSGRLSFNDLLMPRGTRSPNAGDYDKLLDDVGKNCDSMSSTQFGKCWLRFIYDSDNPVVERLRIEHIIRDSHVIDLGGGALFNNMWRDDNRLPSRQSFIGKMGINPRVADDIDYTCVDRYLLMGSGERMTGTMDPYARMPRETLEQSVRYSQGKGRVVHVDMDDKTSYVHADMLDFISRMRDGSEQGGKKMVFVMNGITDQIVEDHKLEGYESKRPYHEGVAREISRALPYGSYVMATASEASKYFEKNGLVPVQIFNPGSESSMPNGIWMKPLKSRMQ